MRINSFVKKSMTTKGSYCTINLILDLDFHMDKAFNSSIDHLNNILFDYEEDQPGKQIVNGADFADTYHKQVLSIILNPSLLQSKDIMEEAKIKAQSYLKIPNFSIGAYSDSKGLLYTRKKISEWYYRRDGYKINEDDLYLTNGGNNAYEHAINLITNPGDSILLPNPCYPFYINLNNSIKLENIFYDVQNGINLDKLQIQLDKQRDNGKIIKAIVVINPHDPLGNILTEKEMEEVVEFCERNTLCIIASEKLQTSVYSDVINQSIKSKNLEFTVKDTEGNILKRDSVKQFYSFREIINRKKSPVELMSIYSISKGLHFMGGVRAGILDTLNLDPQVSKELLKFKSIDLCSSLPGQIYLDLCLNPPEEFGNEFLFNYEKSLSQFADKLKDNKDLIYKRLSHDENVSHVSNIQAGYSFFVRQLSEKFNSHGLKVTNGKLYGKGYDDYINIHINSLI